MKPILLLLVLLAFVVGLVSQPQQAVHAKGGADQIIISGDTLANPIFVTDQFSLTWLSIGRLVNLQDKLPEAPTNLGDGYLVEHQAFLSNGTYTADSLMYYPNAEGPGYVHYLKMLNRFTEHDNKWFYASPKGEHVLQARIYHAHFFNTLMFFGAEGIVPAFFPDVPQFTRDESLQ